MCIACVRRWVFELVGLSATHQANRHRPETVRSPRIAMTSNLASVADDNRRNAKGRRCVLVATSRPTAWGDHRTAVRKRWRRCVRLPTTMAGIRVGVAGSSDLVQGSPANAVLRIVCIVPSRAGGTRLRRPLGGGGGGLDKPESITRAKLRKTLRGNMRGGGGRNACNASAWPE